MSLRRALPLLLLSLAACSSPAPAPAPVAPTPVVPAPVAVAEPAPIIAADEAGIRVVVALSPAAAERLQADAETVVVAATWFGEPLDTPEAQDAADGAPWLVLAAMQQELPGAGETIFPDMPLDPAKLALIATAPQFHVNVFSGRRASEHNVLSCDLFQDDLAKAAAGVRIGCRLIAEKTAP